MLKFYSPDIKVIYQMPCHHILTWHYCNGYDTFVNINENFFYFTLASKWLIQRKCVMYFSTFGVEFLKVEWMQRGQLT